ncbi:hypothetical protein ACGFNU_00250 [Spirillospora sp. NPDC048911]|uniref:hypothetical protein n=1 Tax=Spirillospora sp. NPDC048911 TaxID=3364527 RepID=UPI00371BFDCE
MRIDCGVPLTVRITGTLTDDQLAALGGTLARAVRARLHQAERLLAERYRLNVAELPDDELAGTGVMGGLPVPAFPSGTERAEAAVAAALGDAFAAAVERPEVRPHVAVGPGGAAQDEAVFEAAAPGAQPDDAVGMPPTPGRGLRVTAAKVFSDATFAGQDAAFAEPRVDAPERDSRGVAFIKALGPSGPLTPQRDPVIEEALREARRNPPPKPPTPIVPGDRRQQRDTVPEIDPIDLWRQPRIRDALQRLAEQAEEWHRTHRRGRRDADAQYWADYWRKRFANSVNYILQVRKTRSYRRQAYTVRDFHLAKLRDAEKDLIKAAPADIDARVEELRRTIQQEWMRDVDQAADRYLVLAENELAFFTEERPIRIFGLPEWVEGTLPATAFPALFQQDPNSPGFSPSVARLMAAVQREWGRPVVAQNYRGHERANPFVGNVDHIGKYSFDASLPIAIQNDGFYGRDETVGFFQAVERAAQATDIEWMAFYNDASVANEVNRRVGVRRIYFSGGGQPRNATPEQEGSFHHGPAPYILHVHFNIMPKSVLRAFLRTHAVAILPFLDLGDSP